MLKKKQKLREKLAKIFDEILKFVREFDYEDRIKMPNYNNLVAEASNLAAAIEKIK